MAIAASLVWLAFSPLRIGSAEEPPKTPGEPERQAPAMTPDGGNSEAGQQSAQPSETSTEPSTQPAQSSQEAAQPSEDAAHPPPKNPADVAFAVNEYRVEGNTVLPDEKIKEIVAPYTGPDRRVTDVDKARLALEKAYRNAGYPTVIVVVPEQTITEGVVRLTVIESVLGDVSVTGNRYFSTTRLLSVLPSLRPGLLLYEPTILTELDFLNGHRDLTVTPVLQPGEKPGTVNLELKVVDHLPLHGTLELNSEGTPSTPRYRLNASVQYTNFLTPNRSVSFQTTQSPQRLGEVQMYGMSAVMPLKTAGRSIALYASYSNSQSNLNPNTQNLQGKINILGDSTVFGARYVMGLTPNPASSHQFSLGLDIKLLGESQSIYPGQVTILVSDPVNYMPVTISYSGQQLDRLGMTTLSATIRGNIAGILPRGDREAFGGNPSNPDYPSAQPGNRAGATGTFGVFQAGLDRSVNLPEGFLLTAKADGQLATEPLIPAEQYTAGGVRSVRGYVESEALGDDAVHGSVEIATPPFAKFFPASVQEELRLRVFYDAAYLWLKRVPPGQTDRFQLEGLGFGFTLTLMKHLSARVDQAWAFSDGTVTQKADYFTHFSVQTYF
jgi:hemolysin activation/secretion protein